MGSRTNWAEGVPGRDGGGCLGQRNRVEAGPHCCRNKWSAAPAHAYIPSNGGSGGTVGTWPLVLLYLLLCRLEDVLVQAVAQLRSLLRRTSCEPVRQHLPRHVASAVQHEFC